MSGNESDETRDAAPAPRRPLDLDDTPLAPVTETPEGAGSDASRFLPGQILADRYRIVAALGKGGMGEVYRADDLRLGQPVALKFLPLGMDRDPERLSQLVSEVKVAFKISHPNVCRVHDLGQAEGVYFLSMEYIDGEDMSSLLRRIGPPPRSKSVELARQVCEGLAVAHEAGILHRDLKPANLMIDGEGRARITDFGLAALADSIRGAAVRSGTPAYMAPEQLAGKEVTARSDIYSLGLVLHELFTGRKVIQALSIQELTEFHQRPPEEQISELDGAVDPVVEGVIRRCLAKDPAQRYASAREVAQALEEEVSSFTAGTRLGALSSSRLLQVERVVEALGDAASAALLRSCDELAGTLAQQHGGVIVDRSDGLLSLFERPWEAVRFALEYHRGLDSLAAGSGAELAAQVAIHLGEVVVRRNAPDEVARGARPIELGGLSISMVARLRALAGRRQTLLTRSAFDLARRGAVGEIGEAERLRWLAHGEYRFKGASEAVDVFEVGFRDFAPLEAPGGSAEATRVVDGAEIPGWRPAPGLPIPHRANWVVEEKLGEGGFGEAWLGKQAKTGEIRVYKFCYEAKRLHSLQREITVFRLLKEELGQRDDIARILDWSLDEPPYFIELAHVGGGSLVDWAEAQGGLGTIALADRLEIAAQVATALAAAHSVGVLHKDIKPGNVLIEADREGHPRAVLTDFGIGLITDRERLAAKGITVLGLTEMDRGDDLHSTAGTPIYLAPELLAGSPSTTQADIYALGVMLYQMMVGDFGRPLAQGWQRNVPDELLAEDIASLVDGNPSRRPGNAAQVAELLRSLDQRRAKRLAARQAEQAAARAHRRRRFLATVAAVSSVFLVVVSMLAVQAIRARDDAERRRGQAEQLIDFMLNDLHEGLDKIGRLDLLESVARDSQHYFDSLSERDETPESLYKRGTALQNIGGVLLDQGDAANALVSQRAAVALFEEAAEREPSNDDWKRGLSLSRTLLGQALSARGETDAALAAYRDAQRLAEELLARDQADPQSLFAVAHSHFRIARLQRQIGDLDAVFAEAHTAEQILEKLPTSETVGWRAELLLIDTRMLLAEAHRFTNHLAEALDALRLALGSADSLATEDRGNSYWPRRLAAIHADMGSVLSLQGEMAAALESQRAAIDAYRALMATDPSRVLWPEKLSIALQVAGWIQSQMADLVQARVLYEQSRAVVASLVEKDPERMAWVTNLATADMMVGEVQLRQGDTAAALASLERAVELRRRVVVQSGDNPDPRNYLGYTLLTLGDVYARRNEPRRAAAIWSEAVDLLAPITADSDIPVYQDTHVQALLRLGRLEESRPLVEALLAKGWEEPDFLDVVRKSGLQVDLP